MSERDAAERDVDRVLRRLMREPVFGQRLVTDACDALGGYDLSLADLERIERRLQRPAPTSLHAVFGVEGGRRDESDRPPP